MGKFSKEAHEGVLAGLNRCGQSYTIQVGGYNDQIIKLILSQGYSGLEHKAAHDAYKFADAMMNAKVNENE